MQQLKTLPELIESMARLGPEVSQKALLQFVQIRPDNSYVVQSRSYRQLWSEGQAIAKALKGVGVGKGSRIAIMMENHAEFIDLMVGASIIGAVLVPIDPRTRGEKLAHFLTSTGCGAAVVGSYCVDAVRQVADQSKLQWVWTTGAEAPDSARMAVRMCDRANAAREGPDLPIEVTLDDDMELMSTSGTTGHPKGIQCNYRRYALKGLQNYAWFGIRPDDVLYTGLSLTHGNAQNMSLAVALYNQVPLVLSQKFTKTRIWNIIKDFGCTVMTMLGGMYSALIAEPPNALDARTGLRLINGAGMPKALWTSFARRFNVEILEFYSASEGGMLLNRPGEGPIGSMGRPVEGIIADVHNENDLPCPDGETGELVFRHADGSAPVVRYYNNPEASAKKVRGGWLRSGDLAYRDSEGWYYYISRKEQEIRRNGEFISTGFIEIEIAAHPAVSDVFVYGIDSEALGSGEKDIVAAVVLRDPRFDPRALFEFCSQRMERNAVPSYLQLVDQIPKTASEKPIQRALVTMFTTHPDGVHRI